MKNKQTQKEGFSWTGVALGIIFAVLFITLIFWGKMKLDEHDTRIVTDTRIDTTYQIAYSQTQTSNIIYLNQSGGLAVTSIEQICGGRNG